jgi:hypothetical protein
VANAVANDEDAIRAEIARLERLLIEKPGTRVPRLKAVG